MIERGELFALAPHCRADYVDALCSDDGAAVLAHFGLLANKMRLCGWAANWLHETGGGTILRESMRYTTAQRLREVWPARFGHMSDAQLAPLLYHREHNPHAEYTLAASVYGSRMGNRPGTHDGFYYRGCGWDQNTGREGIHDLGLACGFDFDAQPELMDNMSVMLRVALYEWTQSHGNELMDEGHFDMACAALNTGSPMKVGACVGLPDRRKWYQRCRNLWLNDPDVLDFPAALVAQAEDGAVPGQEAHWTELQHVDEAA